MTVTDYTDRTTAELVALLEADTVVVDGECWLLDSTNTFVLDLSDDLIVAGSSVDWGAYNTLHRTCQVTLTRELAWSSARIKLNTLVSNDGSDWTRFPVGVFLTSTPQRTVTDSDRPTWQVSGYDLLHIANQPLGSSITVNAGDNIIDTIEALVVAVGQTPNLDQTAASTTAASTLSFSLLGDRDAEEGAGSWTTLTVINRLLESIGYRGMWANRNGLFTSEPYRSPSDLPSVWSFDTSSASTMVGLERMITLDYWDAANEIVGVNDSLEGTIPVIDAGIHIETNSAEGPTSVTQRGYTVRKTFSGQYQSQADLITACVAKLDVEKRIDTIIECSVSPNPILGHFNVVSYRDDSIPVNGRHLVTHWNLPLDGNNMTLTLRAV